MGGGDVGGGDVGGKDVGGGDVVPGTSARLLPSSVSGCSSCNKGHEEVGSSWRPGKGKCVRGEMINVI